jgi:parallel beta-helix repeat protein
MKQTSIFLLCFCLPAYLFAQHGVGAAWGAESALIPNNPVHSQRGQLYNNMAVTSAGRIFISTSELNTVTGAISGNYLYYSDDGGTTWSAPHPILPISQVIGGSSPKLAMLNNDTLGVLFQSVLPAAIFFVKYNQDLTWVSDTVRVASSVNYTGFAIHLTLDGQGRLHAVWHEGDHEEGEISECYHSRSTNGGATWSPPFLLSNNDGHSSAFPRAQFDAAPGDTLAITWRDSINISQKWNIILSVSTNGGQTWGAPTAEVVGNNNDSDPDLVLDDQNRIHLFYHQYPVGNPFDGANVRYAWSDDWGANWSSSPFMQLSGPGIRSHLLEGNRYDPDHNVLWSVWKDERDFNAGQAKADMVVSYSLDRGLTWSSPEFATDWGCSSVGFKAGIVLPDGKLAVNYEVADSLTNLNRVYFRKRSLPAATAHKYYFSSSSTSPIEDGSILHPFKSLNDFAALTLAPGDSVLFLAGDTFPGQMTLYQSGTAASPVVFTSYGQGPKPIITGAAVLPAWTSSGEYFTTTASGIAKNFFINNLEMPLARYPDTGFLYLNTGTKTSLSDFDLTQPSGYWTGAKVCVHTVQWAWEKSTVTASSPGSLTFSPSLAQTPINGYGYFLYDHFSEFDYPQEWYFNPADSTLYYYPLAGQDPNNETAEATMEDYGVLLADGVSHVKFHNLLFDKQYKAGIGIGSGNSATNRQVLVDSCDFYRQYHYGVELYGSAHEVRNAYFQNVDGIAIGVSADSVSIHHNTFRNNGQFRNSGIGGETNLTAIKVNFKQAAHIHHNDIDSSGYCGISADGTNHLVERNIARHCMLLNNDGAALKAFAAASSGTVFRNNFVYDTHGNTYGTNNGQFKTPGIYLDWNAHDITIEENTVINCSKKGIFLNGGTNANTVCRNVVYGSEISIDFNAATQPGLMRNYEVKHNVWFARTAPSVIVRQSPTQTGDYDFGDIDSNYLFQPFNINRVGYRPVETPPYLDSTAWQATGNDVNSHFSFASWTTADSSEIFTNPSDDTLTFTLPNRYLDLDGHEVCGNVTLFPYTSKVLINTCLPTCSTCTDTLIVIGNPPGQVRTGAYQAASLVSSTGQIAAGQVVFFKSGGVILLDSGFTVESGGEFETAAESCPTTLVGTPPLVQKKE